jgi:outer membrane receptor protein involved in Fe transport
MNTKSSNQRGSCFSTSAIHRLLLAGACFSLAVLASAQTQPLTTAGSAEDTITLQTFTVNTAKDKGYLAENEVSATRVNSSIAELPFSISALTSQFIADTAPTDLADIAKYSAGVAMASKEFNAGADSFNIRGFTQYPERNGFNETSSAALYVDPVDIERVEVVKGPAALLYGQVSPGGTVNYITKQPQPKLFMDLGTSYGSNSFYRETVDLNVPGANNTLLFRFNGAYEGGLEFTSERNRSETQVYDPSLTWNISKTAAIKANFQTYYKYEHPAAVFEPDMDVATPSAVITALGGATNQAGSGGAGFGATPSGALSGINNYGIDSGINGPLVAGSDVADAGFKGLYPTLPTNFNYDNTSDYRRTSLQSVDLEFDAKISDNWVGRVNYDYSGNSDTFYQTGAGTVYLAAPGSMTLQGNGTWTTTGIFNTAGLTGAALTAAQAQITQQELAYANAIAANPNAALDGLPAVISRRTRTQVQYGGAYSVQPELTGNYDFSWVKVSPLIGASYDKNWETAKVIGGSGSATNPFYRTWDVDPASPTYYINQDPTPIPASTQQTLTTDSVNAFSDTALYGYLTTKFLNDRLIADGGLRYNRSSSQQTQYLTTSTAIPQGPEKGFYAEDTTPELGIGFKVTSNSMIYADYSESYTFTGGTTQAAEITNPSSTNAEYTSVATGSIKPTKGAGEEVGYKSDFFHGRLSSTLSVYRIEQKDAVASIGVAEPNTSGTVTVTNQGAGVTSKGVEYELTATPLDNLQIMLSVSEDDVRYTKEPVGQQIYLGTHPFGSAKTLGNIWSRYNFDTSFLKGFWIGAGANYVGPTEMVGPTSPYWLSSSYTLLNSAVGYEGKIWKIRYSAVINWNNMTNKFYEPTYEELGLPDRVAATLTLHF